MGDDWLDGPMSKRVIPGWQVAGGSETQLLQRKPPGTRQTLSTSYANHGDGSKFAEDRRGGVEIFGNWDGRMADQKSNHPLRGREDLIVGVF